jgi:glycosyltransferase involved in cell wall biosynthesis
MDVLFVVTRLERPSVRFRIAPMIPYFEQRGHTCTIQELPSSLWKRIRFYRQFAKYHAVVIQQRLLSQWELFLARKYAPKLIYDFDDAVMYHPQKKHQERRRQFRFGAMAQCADLAICGNHYLASHVSHHTNRFVVIPTAVDTLRYHPDKVLNKTPLGNGARVNVGWTGSSSTNRYLNKVLPVLAKLSDKIDFTMISSNTEDLKVEYLDRIPFTFVPWAPETEVSQTARFEIGLMPLPDNAWTRGKCGCKALQYLALGIPAVCSPVGMNVELLDHGRNGFLAETEKEWFEILKLLIDDPQKRRSVGRTGRETIEKLYALDKQAVKMVDAVERIAA